MGLDLRTAKPGAESHRIGVGPYHHVHHLRAILVMLFVAQAWQLEGADADRIQEILGWVKGLSQLGIDIDEVEVSEDDLFRAMRSGTTFSIAYDGIVGSPLSLVGLECGTPAANAAIGLRKFVDHSDCDGVLSMGDTADVAALFDFLAKPAIEPPEDILPGLAGLSAFFRQAAESGATVVFT